MASSKGPALWSQSPRFAGFVDEILYRNEIDPNYSVTVVVTVEPTLTPGRDGFPHNFEFRAGPRNLTW